jgi:hypothetical protein
MQAARRTFDLVLMVPNAAARAAAGKYATGT